MGENFGNFDPAPTFAKLTTPLFKPDVWRESSEKCSHVKPENDGDDKVTENAYARNQGNVDEICRKLINEKLALKGQHLRCFNYSVTSCCSRCTVSLEIYQWTDSNAESTNVVYVADKPLNNCVHPQYTTRRAKWRTGKTSNCPKIIRTRWERATRGKHRVYFSYFRRT